MAEPQDEIELRDCVSCWHDHAVSEGLVHPTRFGKRMSMVRSTSDGTELEPAAEKTIE